MPNTSHWILLTADHITETYILPEGDIWRYIVAPNNNLKKGDSIYLWSNIHPGFFGWGEVFEHIQEFIQPEIINSHARKRMSVLVHRQKGFHPPITASMMERSKELRKMIPVGFDDLYAIPLRPGQAHYINDFIREHKLDAAPKGSATIQWSVLDDAPDITVQAIITLGEKTEEGRLVELVKPAWDAIINILEQDPNEIFNIDPFKFEELIAGAYVRDGYIVELTPRSNDKGKDIIATKKGLGAVRIFDQVKRYRINRPVSAAEVRELVGTVLAAPDATQGVITTTSSFATNLLQDKNIKRLMPYRLYLRERQEVLDWLKGLKRI